MVVVKGSYEIEFIEKKSKFIGYLKGVSTVEEANKYIESIRNMHSDATHNVPVYRVFENGQEYLKYNDDGEPLNTAGKPMAEIFLRKDIYNFVLVATRYFGGIKLGAGGLIRNYARVATELSKVVELEEYIEKSKYIISFDYSKKGLVDKIIQDNDLKIDDMSYLEKINIKLSLSNDDKKKLEEIRDIEIVNTL